MMYALLIALLMIGSSVFPSSGVPESARIRASGTFANAGPPTDVVVRSVGNTTIITEDIPYVDTGTVTGTSISEVRTEVFPNGRFNVQIVDTCDPCRVAGHSGTMVSHLVATGQGTSYTGQWTSIRGTGELEDVHFEASFAGTVGVGGTYSGWVHFNP